MKGSQNYGLDTESSDVDSYFVVMPKMEDLALSRPPISTSLLIDAEKNEYAEIKDVRVFFKDLRDAKPTALEVVFSDWFTIVDSKYHDPRNLDYMDVRYTLGHRLESYSTKMFKEINSFDFSKKRDRKTVVNFLVFANFCSQIKDGIRSFYILDENRKQEILKIKNQQMSKDEFLESGMFSKWLRFAVETAAFLRKDGYSSRFVMDSNKMLAKVFDIWFNHEC